MGEQISFWYLVFIPFGYIPRTAIARSFGSFSFNFLRSLYTVFHSSCTNLCSHQCYAKGSLFFTFSPTLVTFCLFVIAILIGMGWYFTVILICISQMISDIKYLFIYLGHLHIFFGKMFIHMFCPLFNQIVSFFFLLSYMSSLYILDVYSLSDIYFANIFFPSIGCLFILLIV